MLCWMITMIHLGPGGRFAKKIAGKDLFHFPFSTASSTMTRAFLVATVALLFTSVAAIYPDDLWSRSTKLTEDNFESVIQEEIDAGRTLFVRWIASPN